MNSVDGTCPTKVIGNCNSRACVNTGFFVYASFRIKNCNHFLAKLKNVLYQPHTTRPPRHPERALIPLPPFLFLFSPPFPSPFLWIHLLSDVGHSTGRRGGTALSPIAPARTTALLHRSKQAKEEEAVPPSTSPPPRIGTLARARTHARNTTDPRHQLDHGRLQGRRAHGKAPGRARG